MSEQLTTTDAPPAKAAPRSLFEIVKVGLAVLEDLDDAEGEVTDELGARLDELADSIQTKAEAYKAVALALDLEADACDNFAHVYAQRAKRKRANVAALKARLKEALELLHLTKAVGPTGGARIQRNGSPSLRLLVSEHEVELEQHGVDTEALLAHALKLRELGIPSELVVVRVELDTAEIKRRLLADEELMFATLDRGTHLRWA